MNLNLNSLTFKFIINKPEKFKLIHNKQKMSLKLKHDFNNNANKIKSYLDKLKGVLD